MSFIHDWYIFNFRAHFIFIGAGIHKDMTRAANSSPTRMIPKIKCIIIQYDYTLRLLRNRHITSQLICEDYSTVCDDKFVTMRQFHCLLCLLSPCFTLRCTACRWYGWWGHRISAAWCRTASGRDHNTQCTSKNFCFQFQLTHLYFSSWKYFLFYFIGNAFFRLPPRPALLSCKYKTIPLFVLYLPYTFAYIYIKKRPQRNHSLQPFFCIHQHLHHISKYGKVLFFL